MQPGDKLASHRDLAEALVIAPLTVKKAYDELERAGYIVTRRGKGTFVAERLPSPEPVQMWERLPQSAPAQAAPVEAKECRVEILSPKPGHTVGPAGVVVEAGVVESAPTQFPETIRGCEIRIVAVRRAE